VMMQRALGEGGTTVPADDPTQTQG